MCLLPAAEFEVALGVIHFQPCSDAVRSAGSAKPANSALVLSLKYNRARSTVLQGIRGKVRQDNLQEHNLTKNAPKCRLLDVKFPKKLQASTAGEAISPIPIP